MDEIPPGKILKIVFKMGFAGGIGGIGDIFKYWTPPGAFGVSSVTTFCEWAYLLPRPEGNGSSFRCYHNGCKCGHTCDFQTDNKEYYERHGALRHRNNPLLYPTKAEIEQDQLKPQGKDWEV